MPGSLPSFSLPTIIDNPSGWGPSGVPDDLSNIPYAPYSKSDRLGKIADWAAPPETRNMGQYQQGQGQQSQGQQGTTDANAPFERRRARFGAAEAFGSGTASAFMYQHAAEEEASFSVVDRGTTTVKKAGGSGSGGGGGGFKTQRGGRGGLSRGFGGGQGGGSRRADGSMDNRQRGFNSRGGGFAGGRRRYGYNDKPQRVRDSSVKVGPEWSVMEEMEFTRLNKLHYIVDEPEDVAAYGKMFYADKTFERISTKFEKPLQLVDRTFHNLTTSDDPILQKLSESVSSPTVFATDNILAVLMCAPRSVYSWDIVIVKEGNKISLDKRDGGHFDFFSVNENASEPPLESTDKDNINTPAALAAEATEINNNFSQQNLKEDEIFSFAKKNPFADLSSEDSSPLASAGYRYRKWDLGDGIDLIARTQLDAVIQQAQSQSQQQSSSTDEDLSESAGGVDIMADAKSSHFSLSETSFVTIKALNEFDSKAPGSGGAPDWRAKLDAQRGAVMATEIKNNGNKLARWTVESILSGADQIRFGFVSRVNPRDRTRHAILGVTSFKPTEFSSQMNLNLGNGWGIVRTIVDICYKQPDGKYVLVKDPNKATLRLYSVPSSTFEDVPEDE